MLSCAELDVSPRMLAGITAITVDAGISKVDRGAKRFAQRLPVESRLVALAETEDQLTRRREKFRSRPESA